MSKGSVPDCLFPSDNDLEIPLLRDDVQPEFCEIPFVCWGEAARTFQMNGNGTLHFYTDDYRFQSVYDHPEKILSMNPATIVEPNFSLFAETPVSMGLQAIYRKRFVARAMQERGIGVLVDLNVNSKFYKLNMLGVPQGYHSFCTRGYSNRLAYLDLEYTIARQWAGNNHLLFVIYGGGNACKDFAQRHNCVYVEQLVNVKNKMKSLEHHIEQIKGTIAFDTDDEMKQIASNSIKQIYDFSVCETSLLQQETPTIQ